MVEGIEYFPPEFEVLAFCEVKRFGQSGVYIPKSRRPNSWKSRPGRAELPGTVVVRIVVRPEALVIPKGGLESGGVNPLINLLLSTPVLLEFWIANQVGPAGQFIAWPTDWKWHPTL